MSKATSTTETKKATSSTSEKRFQKCMEFMQFIKTEKLSSPTEDDFKRFEAKCKESNTILSIDSIKAAPTPYNFVKKFNLIQIGEFLTKNKFELLPLDASKTAYVEYVLECISNPKADDASTASSHNSRVTRGTLHSNNSKASSKDDESIESESDCDSTHSDDTPPPTTTKPKTVPIKKPAMKSPMTEAEIEELIAKYKKMKPATLRGQCTKLNIDFNDSTSHDELVQKIVDYHIEKHNA